MIEISKNARERIRFQITEFRGQELVDIRVWVQGEEGEPIPKAEMGSLEEFEREVWPPIEDLEAIARLLIATNDEDIDSIVELYRGDLNKIGHLIEGCVRRLAEVISAEIHRQLEEAEAK
ncbi:MAG: hypothetical protein ACTSXC_07275 [Candidatus Freyarchaeota archaeon]